MPNSDKGTYITGCLGPRISETVTLKWCDINERDDSVNIPRTITHSRLKVVPKTDAKGVCCHFTRW